MFQTLQALGQSLIQLRLASNSLCSQESPRTSDTPASTTKAWYYKCVPPCLLNVLLHMGPRTSWILGNTFMFRILSLALLCSLMTEPNPMYDEGSVEELWRFLFRDHVSTVTPTICSIFLVFSLHYCHGVYIYIYLTLSLLALYKYS